MKNTLDNKEIHEISVDKDGTTTYEVGSKDSKDSKDIKDSKDFHANLALDMDEDVLKRISTYLIDCLNEDINARQPWLDFHNKVKKYSGIGNKIEDRGDIKSELVCRTFDTTFSHGLSKWQARASVDLLPASGPCSYKIIGEDKSNLDMLAKIKTAYVNYFLTKLDSSYYADHTKSLYYLALYGTMIKKICYDHVTKMPLSRFLLPENFLVNTDCSSILESTRLTHILKLSIHDILIKQRDGIYRKVKLTYGNSSEDSDNNNNNDYIDFYNKRTLHSVYESHVYICLESFKQNFNNEENEEKLIPKPYIITVDKETKQIYSIVRSWKQNDINFNRRKYFVSYTYLSGEDIWNQGLGKTCGTLAMTATMLLRQILDAATLQNTACGFIDSSVLKKETDLTMSPGLWKSVNAAGNLSSSIFPMPVNGPSPTLVEMYKHIIIQLEIQLSSSELGMMDSKEDIATGTAVAFLEEKNKTRDSILKSAHDSMTQEFGILDNIFEDIFEDSDKEESFYFDGMQHLINKKHFKSSIQIVPISDPAANSTVQRIMKAEAAFSAGMQLPDKVDQVALLDMVFKAQGLSKEIIDQVLLKDISEPTVEVITPKDPITENTNLINTIPVKAGIDQNHDAHITVHSAVNNEASQAHIQEHVAFKFLIQMQQELGINLNTIEDLETNIAIQNIIALKAAEVVTKLGLNKNNDDFNQEQTNDQKLLEADILQKEKADIIRKEIAELRAEVDIFKAQLQSEASKEKIKLELQKIISN